MPAVSSRCLSAALLAFASLATVARSQAAYSLQLSGACNYKNDLNGLIYDLQGNTANGSPFYKARGREEYVYFDADCGGGGDGTPRWVLDNDRPQPDSITDLDNDRACNYHARQNTYDGSRPPYTATWKMRCGEGWVDRFITFLVITSTSTTTTSRTTTSSTATATSSTTSTATRTISSTTRTGTSRTSTSRTSSSTDTTTTETDTSTTMTETETSVRPRPGAATTRARTGTTSTVTPGVTVTRTSSTRTTSTTSTVETLVLGGACGFKSFLNGMRFISAGVAANGEPFYRSVESPREQYIYYDLDCNAARNGDGLPRWILDEDEPDASRTHDLDGDGACNYHARHDVLSLVGDAEAPDGGDPTAEGEEVQAVADEAALPPGDEGDGSSAEDGLAEAANFSYSSEGRGPPESSEWSMFCGDGWELLTLTLSREGYAGPPGNHSATAVLGDTLYMTGACAAKAHLNGLAFTKQGRTVIGAPYYKSVNPEQYIYFDPACDGNDADPSPRWIIDASAPNSSLEMDLDDDGACDYHARVTSSDSTQPPPSAMWRMYCGGKWEEVHLTFTDEAPGTTRRPDLVISGALTRARCSAVLALLPALLLLLLGPAIR